MNSSERKVFLDMKKLFLVAQSFTDDLDGLVKNVLSYTKNLETLWLWSKEYPPDEVCWRHVDSFGKTIQSLRSDCLRKIELEEAVCRQDDLISMLDKHKDTLRELRLSSFGLVGSWEDVMIWIRDHCSLTHLRVVHLEEYDKAGTQVSWDVPNDFPNDLSLLDEFLEKRRKMQAELEEQD